MDAKSFTSPVPSAFFLPSLAFGRKPTAGDFARSCYENIAYACRGNLEEMAEVWPSLEGSFRASGSLTRSKVLKQILADVLNRPLLVPSEDRASAIGGAVAGWSSIESKTPRKIVEQMVELSATAPSEDAADYEAYFSRWKLISRNLGSLG
jgi:sugar (pentulose or hexulose) kinase